MIYDRSRDARLESRLLTGVGHPTRVGHPTEVTSSDRSLLGLVGSYRKFIEGFPKITKPMTELLGKHKKSKWMSACEASLQELKKRLTTAPVLVMPDMKKSFSIYCDTSEHHLGCVLMQDDHVVAYTSRQLRKYEEH
jgi:hypothetical protein